MSFHDKQSAAHVVDMWEQWMTPSCGTGRSMVPEGSLGSSEESSSTSSSHSWTLNADQGRDVSSTPVLNVLDTAPYPHCPIFIPSKARYDLERGTIFHLVRELIPFTLVVEAEEVEHYAGMIDQFVLRFYGASGMVHTNQPDSALHNSVDAQDTTCSSASNLALAPPAIGSARDIEHDCDADNLIGIAHTLALSSMSITFDTRTAAERCRCKIAQVYHRGYTFLPITPSLEAAVFSNDKLSNEVKLRKSSGTNYCDNGQTFSWLHTVRTVEEVRRLFQLRVLPESNKGVGYVRNYILHVLVPEVMVGSGVDACGHLAELSMFANGECKLLNDNALHVMQLDVSSYAMLQQCKETSIACAKAPPHHIYGFYWVLDDDIYSFFCSDETGKRNVRLSVREMMRQVERRLMCLQKNALRVSPTGGPANLTCNVDELLHPNAGSAEQVQETMPIFTCREDAIVNNVPRSANTTPDKARTLTLHTYPYYTRTACYSLEYARFAYNYGDEALAVNSYNTIACLFNYHLMHSPPRDTYYPRSVTTGLRLANEVLGYYEDSRPWYRFTVREDYDMTLQLIARGYYTVRFRNIGFDVPQMAKLRGGMTNYYKTCTEHMQAENDRFVRAWPSISQHWVKGKNSTERNDIRVRWDLLHPMRARHPGAFLFFRDPLLPPQAQRRVRANPEGDTEGVTTQTQYAANEAHQTSVNLQTKKPIMKALNVGAGATDHYKHKRCCEDTDTNIKYLCGDDVERGIKTRRTTSHLAPDNKDKSGTHSHNSMQLTQLRTDNSKTLEQSSISSSIDSTTSSRASNWKGYTVEQWRDISSDEAARLGLQLIPNNELKIGQTVAIIPPLFSQNPSVVLATLIDKTGEVTNSRRRAQGDATIMQTEGGSQEKNIEWTAVVQGVRGMPILTVKHCYKPPTEGLDRAATAVDSFFSTVNHMPT